MSSLAVLGWLLLTCWDGDLNSHQAFKPYCRHRSYYEMEATRWRVPIEISRSNLEALVDSSEVMVERESHRLLHEDDIL